MKKRWRSESGDGLGRNALRLDGRAHATLVTVGAAPPEAVDATARRWLGPWVSG